jgi:hypothetical protein
MFGDDALKLSLCTCLEQGSTITIELIAELNATLVIGSKKSLQAGSTLNKCLLAKVLAVEVEQVEGIEDGRSPGIYRPGLLL